VLRRLGGLTVAAGAPYEGVLRAVLLAAKAHDRPGLCRPLAPLLSEALTALARAVPVPERPVRLVPVPSAARAVRERGYRHVERIIAALPGRPRACRLLRFARPAGRLAGLSRQERQAARRGAVISRPAAGAALILVDDVVTSGATLRECARALRAAGGEVLGAVAVASTPLRTPLSPGPDRGLRWTTPSEPGALGPERSSR